MYITLLICLLITIFLIDTRPFIRKKFNKKNKGYQHFISTEEDYNQFIDKILATSLSMAKSKENLTIWSEQRSFTESVYRLLQFRSQRKHQFYNYPRAFLYLGLAKYLIKNNDTGRLEEFKAIFEKLTNQDGTPKFNKILIDHVPFGLCALLLYEFYNEKKFLCFAEQIYFSAILNNIDNGVILYRKNSDFVLYDTLGMTIPFLLKYSKIKNDPSIHELATNQIKNYLLYGCDMKTGIPVHGFNKETKIKVGSTNWGRGIGWYVLGLSEFFNNSELLKEMQNIFVNLKKVELKNKLYSQFPGNSLEVDMSATLMFYYSFQKAKLLFWDKKELIDILGRFITKDGYIENTSGDTYYFNKYSSSFGKSEFSQGMFLLLLSEN